MDVDVENLSLEEKLKFGTYAEVSRISQNVLKENSLFGALTIDKEAKEIISELIWKKLEIYSQDLEAFAKHAKRTTINTDDVKLLVRRNPSLLEHVTKIAEAQVAAKEPKKKRSVKPVIDIN